MLAALPAIAGILDATLLRPLPYPAERELVSIGHFDPRAQTGSLDLEAAKFQLERLASRGVDAIVVPVDVPLEAAQLFLGTPGLR